jgi:hypothetical protein
MMSRNTHLLAVLLSLVAAPALAQINWEGSVLPTAPTGFPILGGVDTNNDGVSDFLFAGGNQIITDGINQTDPTGVVGIGLPWNAEQVWRAYDSAQNILVGDVNQSGTLSIFAGGKLRYQNLVIGAVSEGSIPGANGLDFDLPGSIEDDTFRVNDYRNGGFAGGNGLVTISGFGSLFNNDPNLIARADQIALNLGNGDPIDDIIVDLDAAVQPAGNPFATFSTRNFGAATGGFDVIVGLDGTGGLLVNAGGRMEIQDALMVAVDSQSNGAVTVDGVGSSLAAFGRVELRQNLTESRSLETASFIGGRGNGSMTVSNGARADFFNGLAIGSLGTGNDLGTTARASSPGDGSGILSVINAGSTVNIYPSAINSGNMVGNRALVVGELRVNARAGDLSDPELENPDTTLQQGTLVIGTNAVVNASGRTVENNFTPGNAAIGKRGLVTLTGGRLQVDRELENDGTIKGYGVVRSDFLDTSVYSVIRGGDPNSQNTALTDPLQIVLLNASLSPTNPALFNRGLIDGRVTMDVSGLIYNEGRIETSGEISANSLFTGVTSQIRSFPSSASPLRLQLSNARRADQTGGNNADGNANFGALHNRGLIEGNLDFLVVGGVVNGDNYLPISGVTNNSSTGGTIAGTGRILAGQFINNAGAEVRVRQGESLVIHTNGDDTAIFPVGAGIPGLPFDYRTLNLGSISVTDGDLEIGYIAETGGPFELFDGVAFNSPEVFVNARYAVEGAVPGTIAETTAGTIVSNNGNLHFTTGMINTGVVAFTGGTNLVNGPVYNAALNYGPTGTLPIPGVIVVSGDGTSVTFEDDVVNEGDIGIGPFGSVVNFLGDLTNTGTIEVAFDLFGTNGSQAAYITVQGGVQINGGTIGFAFLNSAQSASIPNDFSVALLTAGDLADDSLFTNLVLPDLPAGKYWDVVYDTLNDEVRLEVVMSGAIGADFDGNGVVSQGDIDVWVRNAGIESGASIIQGDANHDGKVDLADFDILMTQLYTGTPVAIDAPPATGFVPEPTSALLVLLAAAPLARRRR